MMCLVCNQAMPLAVACLGGVRESAIAPYLDVTPCPDCNVMPGARHHLGCDMEQCSVCHGQWIACGHKEHEPDKARWTGLYPGEQTCREQGWYCHDTLDGEPIPDDHPAREPGHARRFDVKWHVRCAPDALYATEDVERYVKGVRFGQCKPETTEEQK